MCYSARVYAELKRYRRLFPEVKMDVKTYVKTFWWDRGKNPMAKAPRALIRELQQLGPPEHPPLKIAQVYASMNNATNEGEDLIVPTTEFEKEIE